VGNQIKTGLENPNNKDNASNHLADLLGFAVDNFDDDDYNDG